MMADNGKLVTVTDANFNTVIEGEGLALVDLGGLVWPYRMWRP
jgi:hypothetical protein